MAVRLLLFFSVKELSGTLCTLSRYVNCISAPFLYVLCATLLALDVPFLRIPLFLSAVRFCSRKKVLPYRQHRNTPTYSLASISFHFPSLFCPPRTNFAISDQPRFVHRIHTYFTLSSKLVLGVQLHRTFPATIVKNSKFLSVIV